MAQNADQSELAEDPVAEDPVAEDPVAEDPVAEVALARHRHCTDIQKEPSVRTWTPNDPAGFGKTLRVSNNPRSLCHTGG
ncbi:MAG: hypothetical protein ACI9HK_001539 [Pirellulaceae bacterium]|jgi:hypothetical protein